MMDLFLFQYKDKGHAHKAFLARELQLNTAFSQSKSEETLLSFSSLQSGLSLGDVLAKLKYYIKDILIIFAHFEIIMALTQIS